MGHATNTPIQDLERNKFIEDSDSESTVRVKHSDNIDVTRTDSFKDRGIQESILSELKLMNEYLRHIYGDSLRGC